MAGENVINECEIFINHCIMTMRKKNTVILNLYAVNKSDIVIVFIFYNETVIVYMNFILIIKNILCALFCKPYATRRFFLYTDIQIIYNSPYAEKCLLILYQYLNINILKRHLNLSSLTVILVL